MLSAYRSVLTRPGAIWFSAAGLVGRLPLSMAGLGMLLLVQADTGSYAVGGSVSAAYMVANALVAIPLGRLVDTQGQARVLSLSALVFGGAMVLLVVAVRGDLPMGTTYAAAVLSGASLPPIDACVRTRWAHVLDRSEEVETAYAFEAVVDEAVFMTGPIVVTLLGTLVDPVAGIAATVVAGVGGSLAFAVQRGTEPPAHPRDESTGPRVALPWRTLAPLTVVCVALGLMFGAAELITVAFASDHGARSASGVLLALWAFGSLIAGAATGAIRFRRGLGQRVLWGSAGLVVAMAPLALVRDVALMGALMLVGGLAIAPTLIATTAMIEQVTPPARLTEGMALLQTGLVAGVAPGAAVAGIVVDHAGSSPAYLVPLGAAVLAVSAARVLPRPAPADIELGPVEARP
jgi:MFS family permease